MGRPPKEVKKNGEQEGHGGRIEILKTLQPHLTVMHCDGENGYVVVKKCEIEKDYYYTGDEFVALDNK